MMKKIAVITPVFNGEKFLAECLKSVALSITSSNFVIEHIVVDDCSTDNSWEIIQDIKSFHMKPFRLEKNSGSSTARNYGVKQTNADFIFCLDVDDVIFQNSLKDLFEFAEKEKSIWVYGDFLNTNESLSYLPGRDYYGSDFKSFKDLLTSMFLGEHFFQGNCFFTKELFESIGGFDESLRIAEDLDLFIRFALAGNNPKYLPAPLYLHRFHENNISKITGRENNFNAHKEDLKKLYGKYSESLKTILSSRQLERIQQFLSPDVR